MLLQRRLSRIIIGVGLLGHGVNVVLLHSGGGSGAVPILGVGKGTLADPLPQALVLTAIVISFAITAFLLAMAYRAWKFSADDEVDDDLEDTAIATMRTNDKLVNDARVSADEQDLAEGLR
jgi:multicomponent Na+:H+ antiporter subunit C